MIIRIRPIESKPAARVSSYGQCCADITFSPWVLLRSFPFPSSIPHIPFFVFIIAFTLQLNWYTKGFTLGDILGKPAKPWSHVTSLFPHGTRLHVYCTLGSVFPLFSFYAGRFPAHCGTPTRCTRSHRHTQVPIRMIAGITPQIYRVPQIYRTSLYTASGVPHVPGTEI